jgi:hypothetical protein
MDFRSDFRTFGFLGFDSRIGLGDRGVHSQHPSDACNRLGDSSGAHLWPDFLTFLAYMVVRFGSDFRVFGFLGFESRFGPGDRGVHWKHPSGACKHLGDRSGTHSWPGVPTFLVHMLAVFFVRFCFPGVSG